MKGQSKSVRQIYISGSANAYLSKMVTQIRLLLDESDQTIFDLEEDRCTSLDVFRDCAIGDDL